MKKTKGRIPTALGIVLIGAAIVISGYNLYDEHRAQTAANSAVSMLQEDIIKARPAEVYPAEDQTLAPEQTGEFEIPDYKLNPKMSMPEQEVEGVEYIGTLQIPVLSLTLPVISEWSYPNLKLAPCRYEGSAYLDNLVIAAHNYKSHFGNLKNLSPGDRVILTDMDGNEFHYEVATIETLKPTAIEDMLSTDYDLSLFTCTLSGNARVTVRCEKLERYGR